MYIKRIKLKNFKSYAEAEFEFPPPEKGRNLILVGAENGHGKTTLLEAIYLCLYDKDAIANFQRAGLGDSKFKYHDFISQSLYKEAAAQMARSYEMVLEMDLMESYAFGEQGIRIVRKWYFDHLGLYQEESNQLLLYYIGKDGLKKPIDGEEIQEYLEDYGLPSEYSTFFFFDGEQLVNIAKQFGAGGWMSGALNKLLGIDLLKALQADVKKYGQELYSEKAGGREKERLSEAERRFQTASEELARHTETLQQWQRQKQEAEARQDDLQMRLRGAGSTQHSKELIAQIEQCEAETAQLNQSIQAALLALPLALLPESDIAALKTQLHSDYRRLLHEQGKEQNAHRLEEFWQEFSTNPNTLELLTPKILKDELLKRALNESWDVLFDKLPPDASDPMQHNYLDDTGFQTAFENIARITSPDNDLGSLNKEKNRQETKLVELKRCYEQQKDRLVDSDRLREELERVQKELAEANQKLGGVQNSIERSQTEANRLKTEWETQQQTLIDSLPKQQKAERAEAVCRLIDDLAVQLRRSKLDAFRKTVSSLHKKIAHDKQIGDIEIGEDGSLSLYSQNGTAIDFQPLSHGEKKILVLTLIAALAEITDYQVPFVVDTPLTSLDTRHCDNLEQYWMNLNRQVIILVQSAEIGSEAYQKLNAQGHIGKSYLIRSQSLQGGGKCATVTPHAYFE